MTVSKAPSPIRLMGSGSVCVGLLPVVVDSPAPLRHFLPRGLRSGPGRSHPVASPAQHCLEASECPRQRPGRPYSHRVDGPLHDCLHAGFAVRIHLHFRDAAVHAAPRRCAPPSIEWRQSDLRPHPRKRGPPFSVASRPPRTCVRRLRGAFEPLRDLLVAQPRVSLPCLRRPFIFPSSEAHGASVLSFRVPPQQIARPIGRRPLPMLHQHACCLLDVGQALPVFREAVIQPQPGRGEERCCPGVYPSRWPGPFITASRKPLKLELLSAMTDASSRPAISSETRAG